MAAGLPLRPPSTTLFVGNLSYETTEGELHDLFERSVGGVRQARLAYDRDSGNPKGFGFVEFYDRDMAQLAHRQMDGHRLRGRAIRLDFADDTPVEVKHPTTKVLSRIATKMGLPNAQDGAAAAAAAAGVPPGPDVDRMAGDIVTKVLADMTHAQLAEVLAQMKVMIERDPAKSRTVLMAHPPLARALYQASAMLGIAAGGGAPPPMGGPGGAPPPAYGAPPPPAGPGVPPGRPPMGYDAPGPIGPPGGGFDGAGYDGGFAGRGPRGPGPGPGGAPPPGPTGPWNAGLPPGPDMGVGGGGGGGDGHDDLLKQVLSLSEEQIANLPPKQRDQVRALQAQMRRGR